MTDRPAPPARPVADAARVAEIAAELAAAGSFTLDLEFVSESRYVPELCLVQVGWGDPGHPEVAAIDPLEVDVRPVVELVADPGVATVLHAGQADLALLSYRFGIEAHEVYDSQIAAAFLGLGEQIGYAGLVESLLGVTIDKASQYTDWCRRPLTEEQLAYALDDVRHLKTAWRILEERLRERGRLAWVEEETERFVAKAITRTPPDEMYRRVKGWNRLRGKALAVLRRLAAWREETALAENRPPSWILQDRPLLEMARTPPRDLGALGRLRGVKEGSVRRYGRAILETIERGAREEPPPTGERRRRPPGQVQSWSVLLSGLVAARAQEADVASRYVATRDDVEALARWWAEGDHDAPPDDLPLLSGWRRELVGEELLSWLRGETTIAADAASEAGLRLVGAPAATAGAGAERGDER